MPVHNTSIDVVSGNGITYSSSEAWVAQPGVLALTETGGRFAGTFNDSVLSSSGHHHFDII